MPPPSHPPEASNVDPTPIPVRWVPVLSLEEAGEVLAAGDLQGALAAVLQRRPRVTGANVLAPLPAA